MTQDRVRKKPLDKGVVIQQRIVEEVDIDAGQLGGYLSVVVKYGDTDALASTGRFLTKLGIFVSHAASVTHLAGSDSAKT